MNTTPENLTQPTPPAKKSGPGCFAIGCFSLIALIIITIIGAYFWFQSFVGGMVNQYTTDHALALPPITLSENQLKDTSARFHAFVDGVKAGKSAQTLELHGQELNVLFFDSPDWKEIQKAISLRVENGSIVGEVSFPLDQLGYKDRFISGRARFTTELAAGNLKILLQEFDTGSVKVPEKFLEALQSADFGAEISKDPELKPVIDKLDRIEIQGDALRITTK